MSFEGRIARQRVVLETKSKNKAVMAAVSEQESEAKRVDAQQKEVTRQKVIRDSIAYKKIEKLTTLPELYDALQRIGSTLSPLKLKGIINRVIEHGSSVEVSDYFNKNDVSDESTFTRYITVMALSNEVKTGHHHSIRKIPVFILRLQKVGDDRVAVSCVTGQEETSYDPYFYKFIFTTFKSIGELLDFIAQTLVENRNFSTFYNEEITVDLLKNNF